ncbi:hypothetical protein Rhe02_21920 [Rhizocola hellebori]|uniref:Winged helix DNA-binding domain-containing protein n=1 Tax=Rhizocola hellebori TaxID=1392758 RepID=A0A8J3Q5C0_9ACTN|nr:winged helix DNA-binding domain-containing protein [Rhizocola hellebori]GIH04125.1 hypothetical protein Rhe02_21920 [Rhizocola hellebori]
MIDLLSTRALNRATLERQLLLSRAGLSIAQVLTRVVGMQAQNPNPPYYGLWARIEGFTADQLAAQVTARQVVRLSLMRGTIHLVTADDCLLLRPLLQPVHERGMLAAYGKQLDGLDPAQVNTAGRRLLEDQPMTFAVLGEALSRTFPGRDPHALAMVVRTLSPLVQVPPRGLWGFSGQAAHTTAESWLGRPLRTDAGLDELFLRYLAGFGPASVRDVQAWSGLTRLGEVATRLRPKLRVFRDEAGVELFDLPDSPRPGEQTGAAVRFVAEFENMLLSYADRTRIIAEEHRKKIFTVNGLVPGTFLLDGFAAGTWKVAATRKAASLTLRPFAKVTKKDAAALEREGARLLQFAAPGVPHDIAFGTPW